MSYVSLEFLFFVIVCLIVHYSLPKRFRYIVLLLASLVFEFIFSKFLVIATVAAALIVYITAIRIGKKDEEFKRKKQELSREERRKLKKRIKKQKKNILALACVFSFGMLVVFKYLGFLTGIFNSFVSLFSSNTIPVVSLIMPIGISYYTLSIVGYVTDVYRGVIKPEKNFLKLLLFTVYFPCIVEGPILSYDKISAQINHPNKITYDSFMSAIELVLLGLIKKMIIADRAGIVANLVFDNPSEYNGLSSLLGIILYSVYIYFDFSGCMDIVIGVSELFGIELPRNFNQPFFSRSIQEFWQRWHITLGDWIKKYIFYPVSLSKISKNISSISASKKISPYYKSIIPMLFSLFFVWSFNGIWHGSSWKYFLYGMYWYVLLSLGLLFEPLFKKGCGALKINRESKPFHLFQMIRTAFIVVIGLAIFRAETISDFVSILASVFNLSNVVGNLMSLYKETLLFPLDYAVIPVFIFIMFIISVWKEKGMDLRSRLQEKPWLRWVVITLSIILLISLGVYGTSYTEQPFVYAQF